MHACGVTADLRAFCWGGDSTIGAGVLGNGTGRSNPSLTPVVGQLPFREVSAGLLHSCGIAGGSVWCWGRNILAALGLPGTTATAEPTAVNLPFPVQRIRAGAAETCVTVGSLIHCWGNNLTGQLGRLPTGGSDAESAPVETDTPLGGLVLGAVNTVTAHGCALGPEGRAFCWGANHAGQLGRTASGSCPFGETQVNCDPIPQPVNTELRFQELAVGADHTCGIANGLVYCWGANNRGQLGDPSNPATPVPTPVSFAGGTSRN
jgi:alpha-tubulin suppressor-like RCC1 family protein